MLSLTDDVSVQSLHADPAVQVYIFELKTECSLLRRPGSRNAAMQNMGPQQAVGPIHSPWMLRKLQPCCSSGKPYRGPDIPLVY
jgi:hypothetical protein